MLTLNDGRNELWQWDTGRRLTVDADCSQVHFSNKVFGRSIDVDVVDGVAIIPDVLLQTDKDLTAWAFVGTAENGYTKINKTFKVNRRNKPADYVFTPPEQTTLGELVERLDKIEESQDPDAIKNAVEDYLQNNPIHVDEKDPTVPEWAKQNDKPKYTAAEVGALPSTTNIPSKISELTNDSGFVNNTVTNLVNYYLKTETYSKEEVRQLISAIPKFSIKPVSKLPTTDISETTIYLLPGGDGDDLYTEYIRVSGKWEILGSQKMDLTGYATEIYVKDYAQPKGNYLTEVPEGYATEEFVKNKIAEAELGGEEVDLSGYAQKSELPTKVSQLENDKGYLTEHQDISGKLDASALPTAINTALAQAKASGEFDGAKGDTGEQGEPGPKGDKGDTGLQGIQGETGPAGANGKDGVSATHSWNGTVLTITSASGTSSADLKGAKGDKGDKGDSIKGDPGANGSDGVSPTVAVSKSGKVTTVSITDKNGTKTATINDGADGSPGSAGKDGASVTVKSVSESSADGGSNVVTFSDGKTLTIKNGSKGSTGATGATGSAGVSVSSVKQTTTSNADGGSNVVTVTLSNGTTSTFTVKNGSKGSAGTNGTNGKTPVKGVDYWTAADQEAIVQQVIAALGTPVFGRVDADNNIILTGELADGTYTIKYEDAEGEQTVIGTLNHSYVPEPTYTNQIPISTDTDGSVFNGKGYAGNSRFNNSGAVTSGNYYVTGFIPFTNGSVIRSSKGMFDATDSGGYPRVAMYDNNKAYVTDWRITPPNLSSKSDEVTVNADGELWFNLDVANVNGAATANSIKYARICASHIDDSSVITINEEIV